MASEGYSTAFEKLVDTENVDEDLVGLLAYAYYKRDKRDLAIGGEFSEEQLADHHRRLTDRLVRQYRENALIRLESYSNEVLERARPQIAEETRTESIEAARSDIIDSVKTASVWWHSVLWNVIA